LKNEIEKLKNENKKLLNENKDLKSEIEKLKNDNEELKSEIEKLKNENTDLKSEITDLKNEITDLKKKNKVYEEMRQFNGLDELLKRLVCCLQDEINDLPKNDVYLGVKVLIEKVKEQDFTVFGIEKKEFKSFINFYVREKYKRNKTAHEKGDFFNKKFFDIFNLIDRKIDEKHLEKLESFKLKKKVV
jgi:predicted RNase H-like nuclease (RuvC/YqgF family)